MDPGKALSFAWNLANFLSHLKKLLGDETEVVNAPSLAPHEAHISVAEARLEDLCDAFTNNTYGIFDADLTHTGAPDELREDIWAFNDIASTCRGDFNKLTNLMEEIRSSNLETTRWPNFRHALQSHWYTNEVDDLQRRCHDSTDKLSRHVFSLTRSWVQKYQHYSGELRLVNGKHNEEIPEHFRHQIGFSPHLEAMPRLATEILERLQSVEDQEMPLSVQDVEFCKTKINTLQNSGRCVRAEQALIDYLAFEGYDVQFKSIPDAVNPMFSWAFSSPDSPGFPTTGSELNKWLKHGNGMALVTGDSGSGKSMLMKHVSTHPDLDSTLYQWSNPKPVIVASHFFSNPGTPMQRSRVGMLQTLLRTLLIQLPGDIEGVCRSSKVYTPEMIRHYQWTITELEQHLIKVLSSHSNLKFCLFIDGVDKYEGDAAELASFLQRLLDSANVKLCVSSTSQEDVRNGFTTHFITIEMGSVTLRDDVELYIAERLKHHPFWHSDQGSMWDRVTLSRTIAERSRNLLWGRIAVEHLGNRYRSGHTLQDLKRCLDEMPSQLGLLVKHCLLATPASVAQMGAYFFLIALAARDPPPLSVYHFVNSEQQHRTDYALSIPPRASTPQRTIEVLQSARHLLERRCGIFLQVRPDSRVGFPHKAIRDIVNSVDVVAALRAKAAPKHHVHLSMARAYLAYMKSAKLSWGRPPSSLAFLRIPSFSRIFGEFLTIARILDSDPKMYQLLDDWESCFLAKSESDQAQLDATDRVKANAAEHFRGPVLDALLSGYLDHKLRKQSTYLQVLTVQGSDTAKPVLSLVLASMFDSSVHPNQRSGYSQMLMCLLRHGHDPNHGYHHGRPQRTPWTEFVRQAVTPQYFRWALHSGLFSFFLDHKASPNAFVWDSHPPIFGMPRREYTLLWVVFVFSISDMLRGNTVVFSEADKQGCLFVMDALCAAGASAKMHPSCDFVNSPELCRKTDWTETLIRHVLDATDLHSTNLTFRAALVERILLILVRARFDVEWSWPILRQSAAPQIYDSIKERVLVEERKRLGNGTSNGAGASNPGKRAPDETPTDSETSSKRARSEAEDETMTMTMTMSVRTESGSR